MSAKSLRWDCASRGSILDVLLDVLNVQRALALVAPQHQLLGQLAEHVEGDGVVDHQVQLSAADFGREGPGDLPRFDSAKVALTWVADYGIGDTNPK